MSKSNVPLNFLTGPTPEELEELRRQEEDERIMKEKAEKEEKERQEAEEAAERKHRQEEWVCVHVHSKSNRLVQRFKGLCKHGWVSVDITQ